MNDTLFKDATLRAAVLISAIFLIEWFLFRTFVAREMAWSPFLNGDAIWYVGQSYRTFDSLIRDRTIPTDILEAPHGIMLHLVASALYLLFGASRLAALSTNFIFYLLWQASIIAAARHITKSWSFALTFF